LINNKIMETKKKGRKPLKEGDKVRFGLMDALIYCIRDTLNFFVMQQPLVTCT